MKKILTIFILIILLPSCVFAKGFKGYICHYWTAFTIVGDRGEGGPSYYKLYLRKEFKNKNDCILYTQTATETPAMEKRYPIYGGPKEVWFMGCDKNW